jgi:peptide/nickel transport system ATP-binding protein
MSASPTLSQMDALLEIKDLSVAFDGADGRRVRAVDGVSLAVKPGRILGLVGESGSGKSVTSLSVMGLLPKDSARISGSIRFKGEELLGRSDDLQRDLNGNQMAMIFQEPMTSLNPAYTIGDQISEVILRHRAVSKAEAKAKAIEMLHKVRIPTPEQRFFDYPHRLSGGMRQRVMIAMALALDPQLLIADEPTTALDVTIQAQILRLIRSLQSGQQTAVILITHDLGVVAELCDDVAVMYAGQVVEQAPVADLFTFPQHPYTVGLLGSLPRLERRSMRLAAIDGAVPDMTQPQQGCRFAARCPFAEAKCREETPALAALDAQRFSRCIKAPLERLVA